MSDKITRRVQIVEQMRTALIILCDPQSCTDENGLIKFVIADEIFSFTPEELEEIQI
ncbi:MAG: hypothetical protein GY804_00125 [Alphaproteobacteria bacterium]|nr:hypothetical protein [Alphaproteobacteria bacterium]